MYQSGTVLDGVYFPVPHVMSIYGMGLRTRTDVERERLREIEEMNRRAKLDERLDRIIHRASGLPEDPSLDHKTISQICDRLNVLESKVEAQETLIKKTN